MGQQLSLQGVLCAPNRSLLISCEGVEQWESWSRTLACPLHDCILLIPEFWNECIRGVRP
jgi:hypothetical protein